MAKEGEGGGAGIDLNSNNPNLKGGEKQKNNNILINWRGGTKAQPSTMANVDQKRRAAWHAKTIQNGA